MTRCFAASSIEARIIDNPRRPHARLLAAGCRENFTSAGAVIALVIAHSPNFLMRCDKSAARKGRPGRRRIRTPAESLPANGIIPSRGLIPLGPAAALSGLRRYQIIYD